MGPYTVLVTGFPGSGKYTVAKALTAKLESAGQTVRLVDNHWISNPIFGLVEQDGVTPLPAEVWERVAEVAEAVMKTVEQSTPVGWHVVFTAYLDLDTGGLQFERVARVAARRNATLVPVRLLCDAEENARRIVSSERRERMKSIDSNEPFSLAARGPAFDPGHPNTLSVDNTHLTPEEAAGVILDHASNLTGQAPTSP